MSRFLNEWLVGVAAKSLSAVEINPARSNQHEFQATREIQSFLGSPIPRREIPTRFIYLNDDLEPVVVDSNLTYYDARENHPSRSEARLYYQDNTVIRSAQPGDIFLFAARKDGTAAAIVAKSESTAASQLLWLFNLELTENNRFISADSETFTDPLTSFDAEVLLDLLAIEVELTSDADLEAITTRFGNTFPTTAEFSSFARMQTVGPKPQDDPDGALLAWWDTEYRLFQAFERSIVEARLHDGFKGETAVEDFLQFSLSVQNRRKSRSGHAFEHHLAALFDSVGIKYQRGATTERKSKPDFLFPSQAAYADPRFPQEKLHMLGAKTTAKDRWRQILTEADRIPNKHLVTLQPAISEDQTSEMEALKVQLVVPKGLHASYSETQRRSIWELSDFLFKVAESQTE